MPDPETIGDESSSRDEKDTTLVETICTGLERVDLDAHLTCLALSYTFFDLQRTPFGQHIQAIQSMDFSLYEKARMRPHDVAVAGIRLALHWPSGQARQNFEQWCALELRRQPLSHLDTVATDPRLLIGVIAGAIQVVSCHSYKKDLWAIAESFCETPNVRPWQYVLACWARRLLAEGDEYLPVSGDLSRYLTRLKSDLSSRDRAIAMWVIFHHNLFMPNVSEMEFAKLEQLAQDLRQVSHRNESLLDPTETLEMTFIYDALQGEPISVSHYQRPVQAVLNVIEAFDRAAIRLEKERRKDKQSYTIEDEYDVQDLFYTMLLPELPDLEPEDPTNKDAGSSKKIDFISRRGRIGIEIKQVGNLGEARKIADALKIDIESYHIHPACQTLISFVYDPQRCITNAPILERDLSGSRIFNGRPMEVITRIRPH